MSTKKRIPVSDRPAPKAPQDKPKRGATSSTKTKPVQLQSILELFSSDGATYRSMFENMSRGVIFRDDSGVIIAINPAGCHILGLTEKELVGRKEIGTGYSYLTEQLTEKLEHNPFIASQQDNIERNNQVIGIRNAKSGDIRWISYNKIPLLEVKATHSRYSITTFEDITNKKRMTEIAKQVMEQTTGQTGTTLFHSVVRLLTEIVHSKYVYISEIHDLTAMELKTLAVWDNGHFEENYSFRLFDSPDMQVLASRKINLIQKDFRKKYASNESYRNQKIESYCGIPLHDSNENIIGLLTVMSDIPITDAELFRSIMSLVAIRAGTELERHRNEASVRKADDRFRLLYNSMSEGVAFHEVIYNEDGTPVNYRILDVNNGYENILNLKRGDVVGKLATEVYKVRSAPYLKEFANVALTNIPYRFEVYFEPLKRHFDISVASLETGQFSTIFTDITLRKTTETALTRSESQLRLIAENMIDIIGQIDNKYRFLYISPSVLQAFGYHFRQLLDRTLFELIHPEDLESVRTKLQECVRNKEIRITLEYRHATENGDYRWVESAITFLYDVSGIHQGGIVAMRDVTERKQTQQAYEMSDTQFRSLTEGAKDAILIKDRNLRYLYVNPIMAWMMNLPVEEIIGKTDREMLGERASSFEIADQEVLAGKVVETEPTEKIHGSWKTLHTIKVPLRTKDGDIVGICGIARDVTERNEAELALRESEERFRALVETLPVGVIAHCEGKIVFANQTVVNMMRAESILDIVGKNAIDFVYPEDRELVLSRMRTVIEKRTLQPTVEERFVRLDGTIVDFEVTSVPFTYQNKPAAQIVLVDVAERKKAEDERRKLEAQIQHTQKLESLGVLAGGIAHDFNNLLVGVLGNAGLALMELPDDSPARRSVEAIETAAVRASELTKQMLAYSGKGRFVVQLLNLTRVVEEISHLLEVSISKRVTLSYDFAKELPFIEGDVTQIRQVVMNLITNASEAIGERNGIVRISTGTFHVDKAFITTAYTTENLEVGDYVFIEVADTGCGMDLDTMKRIFDPFFTTKFTGRGLGLAAVIGIVRGHRGVVEVRSELGKGTTFRILFPKSANTPHEQEQTGQELMEEWKATGVVLVVDDETSVLTLARQLLEMKGFKVVTAVDGEEAVEKFKTVVADVSFVLLDMTLPKLSGEEVYRKIRKLRPDVRILLSSGFNEQEVTEKFAGEAPSGFIQKPYRIQELLDKIHEILSK